LLILAGVLLAPPTAQANHRTDLTSAFDEGNPYDFNVLVGYNRTLFKGAVKREALGAGHKGGTGLNKEINFSNVRHTLRVRAEAAIWRDLQLHFELPIVLADHRELKLADNGSDGCGNPNWTNCVTKENSTLIRDGFVPDSTAFPANTPGALIGSNDGPKGGFLLPNRSGLDQMHLGISWAPLNQNRDATKPNWVIGFEARIAIGKVAEYNPYNYDPTNNSFSYDENKAGANTAVGQGLHHFHFFMTLSRRFQYVDPYFTIFYFLPVATKDSLYKKTTFEQSGQERHEPQQRGGVEMGIEAIPWEDKERDMKIGVELWGRLEGVFEGRGYSPMWEVFANNPILNGPCRRNVGAGALNSGEDKGLSKWQNGTYCEDSANNNNAFMPYPGISSIENHALFKGGLNINAQLTKYFWMTFGMGIGHEQAHFITFADTGKDRNKSGQIERFYPTQTEADAINKDPNDNVTGDPGAYDEINPIYRPYVDLAGRRFRVTDTTIFDIMVAIKGQF